jgi:hypothetical protein
VEWNLGDESNCWESYGELGKETERARGMIVVRRLRIVELARLDQWRRLVHLSTSTSPISKVDQLRVDKVE